MLFSKHIRSAPTIYDPKTIGTEHIRSAPTIYDPKTIGTEHIRSAPTIIHLQLIGEMPKNRKPNQKSCDKLLSQHLS